jgi:DNA-binding MarR family transcriptional regulator
VQSRAPRRLRKRHDRGELRAVVDETIALFHRLRWVAEQIYGSEGRSTARRGLLRGLSRYGPQTVATLARTRFVTRQHVQEVVDALARDGLVELISNPEHARSRLVRATPRGETMVVAWDETDARVLAAVGSSLTRSDLESTARTLRAIREGFEVSMRWRPVVPASTSRPKGSAARPFAVGSERV